MAKVKVRLKHTCNAPEHPGGVGDVVHVDSNLAEAWEDKGGCVVLEDDEPLTSEAKPAKPAKPAKSE
jgi:hypothetical protein